MSRNKIKPLNRNRRNSVNIDRYADEVTRIWGEQDKERLIVCQWLGVVKHATDVAEAVRRWQWHEVAHGIAEVFVWWLSFVTRLAKDPNVNSELDLVLHMSSTPSDVIWFKFPNVCPVCFGFALTNKLGINPASIKDEGYDRWSKTESKVSIMNCYNDLKLKRCRCLLNKDQVEDRSDSFKKWVKSNIAILAAASITDKPSSLKKLEDTFKSIYAPACEVLTPDEIAFHLLEEVGEVSEAILSLHLQPMKNKEEFLATRKKRIQSLAEELADVFSWLVTMLATTHDILSCATKYVEEQEASDKKMMSQFVSQMLSSSENLVDLVWHMFESKDPMVLGCDKCREPECDENSIKHIENSGMVVSRHLKKFSNDIKIMKIF